MDESHRFTLQAMEDRLYRMDRVIRWEGILVRLRARALSETGDHLLAADLLVAMIDRNMALLSEHVALMHHTTFCWIAIAACEDLNEVLDYLIADEASASSVMARLTAFSKRSRANLGPSLSASFRDDVVPYARKALGDLCDLALTDNVSVDTVGVSLSKLNEAMGETSPDAEGIGPVLDRFAKIFPGVVADAAVRQDGRLLDPISEIDLLFDVWTSVILLEHDQLLGGRRREAERIRDQLAARRDEANRFSSLAVKEAELREMLQSAVSSGSREAAQECIAALFDSPGNGTLVGRAFPLPTGRARSGQVSLRELIDLTRLRIACGIWELRIGSLPDSLHALVDSGLIDGIPHDWRRPEGGLVRYDRDRRVIWTEGPWVGNAGPDERSDLVVHISRR
jgi:hypothetical protein